MGDLMTQHVNFNTGCTSHVQQIHFDHAQDHKQETNNKIKGLQEMNAKLGLNIGVNKLTKEQKQALKDHVDDLMTRFWVKSFRWTAYNN